LYSILDTSNPLGAEPPLKTAEDPFTAFQESIEQIKSKSPQPELAASGDFTSAQAPPPPPPTQTPAKPAQDPVIKDKPAAVKTAQPTISTLKAVKPKVKATVRTTLVL
jgi:hypothetical protein